MEAFKSPFPSFKLLNRAYQGLKSWFDPAVENNPYLEEERLIAPRTKEVGRFRGFGRRKFAWKSSI